MTADLFELGRVSVNIRACRNVFTLETEGEQRGGGKKIRRFDLRAVIPPVQSRQAA